MAEQFRDFDPSRVEAHWAPRFEDYRRGRNQTSVTHEELYWLAGDIATVREHQQGIVPQNPEDEFMLAGTEDYSFYLQKGIYVPGTRAEESFDPRIIQVVAQQEGDAQDILHRVEYRLHRPDDKIGRNRFEMQYRSTVNRDPLGLEFIETPFIPVEQVVAGKVENFNFYWGIMLLTSHQNTPPEKNYANQNSPTSAA